MGSAGAPNGARSEGARRGWREGWFGLSLPRCARFAVRCGGGAFRRGGGERERLALGNVADSLVRAVMQLLQDQSALPGIRENGAKNVGEVEHDVADGLGQPLDRSLLVETEKFRLAFGRRKVHAPRSGARGPRHDEVAALKSKGDLPLAVGSALPLEPTIRRLEPRERRALRNAIALAHLLADLTLRDARGEEIDHAADGLLAKFLRQALAGSSGHGGTVRGVRIVARTELAGRGVPQPLGGNGTEYSRCPRVAGVARGPLSQTQALDADGFAYPAAPRSSRSRTPRARPPSFVVPQRVVHEEGDSNWTSGAVRHRRSARNEAVNRGCGRACYSSNTIDRQLVQEASFGARKLGPTNTWTSASIPTKAGSSGTSYETWNSSNGQLRIANNVQ